MKKLLQFLILILCSCSIDSKESGEKLSFRMLSVCDDSDEEDAFLDSTVFVKNPDGSADAEWKMFWQCGMDSYLSPKERGFAVHPCGIKAKRENHVYLLGSS